ncbi:serine hydrolase [Alsobacter sp. R-9]
MLYSREFGRRCTALASIAVTATVILVSVAGPAEARRRSVAKGGGYNPPYAAMVVDAKTGRVLHATNEDATRHPASVTKVMTLYLLFEQMERGRFNLNSELKISAFAARQAPSKLGLRPGETIEVEDAIKALVTKSANDIAVAVAENIAGSEEAFAEQMTRKARQLGMNRTVYKNASGLPDPGQITTARDLITLGRAMQDRFPKYYHYFSLPGFTYAGRYHRNHNRLLSRVEGMDGIKTGYTRMSGFNLLTSVRTDGRHIVAVVLGGRSAAARDNQMASLLHQGIERAYAGARTAPQVGEGAAPAVAAAEPRVRVASADDETPVTTAAVRPTAAVATPAPTAAPAPAATPKPAVAMAPPPAAAPKTIELSAARPVVASAAGATTTTPSSASPATGSNGMRWVVGAQPKAEETKVARAEPTRAEPARPEPKAEARSSIPKSAMSGWLIQLGATDDEAKAKEILSKARSQNRSLAKADAFTEKVSKGGSTLYRARFSGFDEDDAQSACKALKRSGFACFAIRGG